MISDTPDGPDGDEAVVEDVPQVVADAEESSVGQGPETPDDLPETVPDGYAQAVDDEDRDDDSSKARLPKPDVPYGTPGNPLGPGAGG